MINRRQFLQAAALAGGTSIGSDSLLGQVIAQENNGQLDYLDRQRYTGNMTLHTTFKPHGLGRMQMQMYSDGEQRYFFTDTHVLNVTNPLQPELINENAWEGGGPSREPTLAYNERLGKWLLIVGENAPGTRNKYGDPSRIDDSLNYRGLRGVRIYDATDPRDIRLLSKWSTDQGDPEREVQTGEGCFRIYYDGGRYAYLNASPDNRFNNMEHPGRYYSRCMQIIDLEDPTNPRFVSNWWVPGQREDEVDAYQAWIEYGDRRSWTGANSRFYVPKRIEDGGRYCFGTWGSFGMLIHDVSDPENPQLVSTFRGGERTGGTIDFFNCDLSWLDKDIVITHSETISVDCEYPIQTPWVLDVSDMANPTVLSHLPLPGTPPEAPYDDFCQKRGRFGPRYAPALIAPGSVDRDLLCMTWFIAGLQCYDISNPRNPERVSYFVPPQGGDLDNPTSYIRSAEGVFVEWDRRLIWVGTDSGLYLVSTPELGEPILEPLAVRQWTLPHVNQLPK